MMKILVITESIPFPPANGKEVTISKTFEIIAKKHAVDVMVVTPNIEKERVKLRCLPNQIRNAFFLQAAEINSTRKILRSIFFFRGVISFYNYTVREIKKTLQGNYYDFVFLMPVKHYGLIELCRKNRFIFFDKLILGLSDTKTHSYRDYINEVMYPRIFNWKYITFWLRSYIVFFEERAYLKRADFAYVQTEAEADKIGKILPSAKQRTIVAPNGVREELFACTYKGVDSNYILYITQHVGGRWQESKWFIKKVWPTILTQIPGAKLWIVGKPPDRSIKYLADAKSVIINGFADDLVEVYNNVRVAVVPIFHGTGLINRILEGFIAGVPVVSTPISIAPFLGVKENREVLSASTPDEFATQVVKLFKDKAYRIEIGKAGRRYAESFSTWEQTAKKIETAMLSALQ